MELLLSAARALGVWAYLLLPLTAVLVYGFYNAWLHPLRQYPGPFLWRAYRLPYVVSIHKGQVHNRLQEFHTKYGPIVRIAPDELSYADSRAWKDIYIPRPGHQLFQKNRTWFKKQAPDEPHSIMSYDEASHSRFRRAFAGAFSDTTLRDQAPIVEGYVNLLISRLRDSASRTVDLEHMFECIAFDIGSDLSFGESFNSLKSGKQHPWVEVAKGFGRGLALIATINKYPPVDRLLRSIMPKKVMEKMRDHAMMSSAMAQKRIAMDIDRPDFVTATRKYVEAKGGVQGRKWDINLMIMVFASSETLASALTATIRELVQNPGVLYRLTTELRSTFSSDNEITVASTTHLPYLKAVINEGLRLDPPTVISPPRVVPPGGDKVCDRFVPAGTYVAYNQFAANRQDYNFHLPNTFLPERFLKPYHPDDDMASFQPFHLGRHQCIGLKLAWAEMRVVIARVLYVFDLRLADEKERCDWGDQKSYITWVKRPLNVVIEHVEAIA